MRMARASESIEIKLQAFTLFAPYSENDSSNMPFAFIGLFYVSAWRYTYCPGLGVNVPETREPE